MSKCSIICVFAGIALAATGAPITWVFSDVVFTDGGTLSGEFTFDPDAGAACILSSSPCGMYSSVDITTSSWGKTFGATYLAVCQQDVATCTALAPDSTEVLFLTNTQADQTGFLALAVFFTGNGATPPSGLTDSGGSIDVSGTSLSVGAIEEAICTDPACDAPSSMVRTTNQGVVVSEATSAPEPSYAPLLALAVVSLVLLRAVDTSKSRRAIKPSVATQNRP